MRSRLRILRDLKGNLLRFGIGCRQAVIVLHRCRASIRPESLPEVSVGLTKLINWMPLGIGGRIAAVEVRRLTTEWPLWGSTLQSIQRGRLTEIDYLNGEIVERLP